MSTTPTGPSPPPHSDAETIEFGCRKCGRLLKVPAVVAGKSAKCPQCDTIQQVPLKSTVPETTVARPATEDVPPSFARQPPAPQTPAPAARTAPPARQPPAFQVRSPVPTEDQALSLKRTLKEASTQVTGRSTPTKQMFDRITGEIAKVYIGQDELVMGALVALFSSGHILIESVPGLGKTLFVRTLGQVLGCQFGRIQFTADLMPSDITGAPMFDMKSQEFRFRPGPVFTQLLLADEINRSPAKTHAALLEIMQEYRVTVDGISHTLERPFLVMATQNPIESEGTYNLPEAQLDRFMFKLIADYPLEEEEASILKMHGHQVDINQRLEEDLETVTSPREIMEITRKNGDILVDDRLVDYINRVVRLTRQWPQFHMGASPRAGIALIQGARTLAAFAGRNYAVPDDVVQIVLPALRHRVILTAEAEVEGHNIDDLLSDLVRSVEVPRI
ncbi:MAG: AAA family ATPase [Pirellulaceae bacterium]